MALVMTASLFGWVITRAQAPQMMGKFLVESLLESSPILLIINLFLLFVSCLAEAIAAQMILIPPYCRSYSNSGINLIHFELRGWLNDDRHADPSDWCGALRYRQSCRHLL